ncbi:MAG: RNA-binding transcriptional accessory protein [Deltaproteobacteria bacterium]|jgi:uncharacterized protein|nr:RNA-binding transcriptional accessory protein [Deltaproteobacteria bacterium]
MNELFNQAIAAELDLQPFQVLATSQLLQEGATIPFIARYRKEATGGLDEVQVVLIRDLLKAMADLADRLSVILQSLATRNLLTTELEQKLRQATTMTELEDIYLPFRPKKKTRGLMAREKGLEPLAKIIRTQNPATDPLSAARQAIADGAQVESPESALDGARDIIAEDINETKAIREALRNLFENEAIVTSRVQPNKEPEAQKYLDYFDYSEPLMTIPSHRYLAIRRGESQGYLTVRIQPPQELALSLLTSRLVTDPQTPCGQQMVKALTDSFKRLLSLSLETEARLNAKKKADAQAVNVFAQNLRELLLAPPLGAKAVLAIDPGFRNGCKMAALSAGGTLLEHLTIYPHTTSAENAAQMGQSIIDMIQRNHIKAVAVGDGTASRETVAFVKTLPLPADVIVIEVSECGASVYSASEIARTEFPDLDLTIRGAISIGRRLMDPLAELVKIDPKSIGVGQYQHDVDQGLLQESLKDVVKSCVNCVGVEVNTASETLLQHVSGLGPRLAKNFVTYRRENGPFKSRQDFLKVPQLGPKAFEQCAGFLRLAAGDNPLDRSAVHPECYYVVEKMATDLNISVADLLSHRELRSKIVPAKYITTTIGLPTLTDIMSELDKPGRDPRSEFKIFAFDPNVKTISDLKAGMRLPAKITNVTAFGAFADVGVHQDGLIHISQLADRFIKHPSEAVQVGQEVTATVLEVDIERGRLSLSLKTISPNDSQNRYGQAVSGKGTSESSRRSNQGPNSPRSAPQKQPATPLNSAFQVLKKLI